VCEDSSDVLPLPGTVVQEVCRDYSDGPLLSGQVVYEIRDGSWGGLPLLRPLV